MVAVNAVHKSVIHNNNNSFVRSLLTMLVIAACFGAMSAQAAELGRPALSVAASDQVVSPTPDQRSAIEQGLRHIYAVYLGIRSCSEISTMQNDRSFMPEVSLDEARRSLRQVDAAAREVGFNTSPVWDAEAPIGLITAEALKTRPETHLVFCQKMGSLFRTDAGNLQSILRQLGARTPIITKDY